MKSTHKRVGIKDIAERAGVSVGPVDKVLNNRSGVSKKTEEKIHKAIRDLGYRPNILASRLKSTKSFTIAVLMPNSSKEIPYWNQHEIGFKTVEEELEPYGFNLERFYFNQNNEASFKSRTIKILKGSFDGIFMVPVFYDTTVQFLKDCKRKETPVIFFDSTFPKLDYLSFVGQDAKDSGYIAADLLNRCVVEPSPFLIITIKKKDDNHRQFSTREEGFKEFFKGTRRKLIIYENSAQNGSILNAELEALLMKHPTIQGIFVTNGVDKVAEVLDHHSEKKQYRLMGYDLIEENIAYLKNGTIDFLISQQPHLQSYLGIKYFYDYLVLKQPIKKEYFLPIIMVMNSTLKYQTFAP